MDQNRRNFLKSAGVLATIAATGGLATAHAQTKPDKAQSRGWLVG